jgi:hypothetical protein
VLISGVRCILVYLFLCVCVCVCVTMFHHLLYLQLSPVSKNKSGRISLSFYTIQKIPGFFSTTEQAHAFEKWHVPVALANVRGNRSTATDISKRVAKILDVCGEDAQSVSMHPLEKGLEHPRFRISPPDNESSGFFSGLFSGHVVGSNP